MSLTTYLAEIKNHDILTAEEEITLATSIQAGIKATKDLKTCENLAKAKKLKEVEREGLRAKEKLIESNLRLVFAAVKRFASGKANLSMEDLIQVGNIGLIRATESFDPSFGTKFSTYAFPWIMQTLRRDTEKNSRLIRLPSDVFTDVTKVMMHERCFVEEFGRNPTDEELSKILECSEARVRELKTLAPMHTSLEVPSNDDTSSLQINTIADEEADSLEESTFRSIAEEKLREILAETLTPRELEITKAYFGLDSGLSQTLQQIADKTGITRERVRAIKARAIEKLQKPTQLERLEEFFYLFT